jgi:hypothetical protein
MIRIIAAPGLFLVALIGFAGIAPAQYNPQYTPGVWPTNPSNQGYQGNPGGYQAAPSYPGQPNPNQGNPGQGYYQGGQQGTYQGNPGQGYQGGQQGGYQGNPQGTYQGNQVTCPYGQQFDPRQNRCAPVATATPTCPAGQQFDQGQNRCVYTLPGGVTVPGSVTR